MGEHAFVEKQAFPHHTQPIFWQRCLDRNPAQRSALASGVGRGVGASAGSGTGAAVGRLVIAAAVGGAVVGSSVVVPPFSRHTALLHFPVLPPLRLHRVPSGTALTRPSDPSGFE